MLRHREIGISLESPPYTGYNEHKIYKGGQITYGVRSDKMALYLGSSNCIARDLESVGLDCRSVCSAHVAMQSAIVVFYFFFYREWM